MGTGFDVGLSWGFGGGMLSGAALGAAGKDSRLRGFRGHTGLIRGGNLGLRLCFGHRGIL